jgi:CubicO group peptidase (beta-lactamase class C family)
MSNLIPGMRNRRIAARTAVAVAAVAFVIINVASGFVRSGSEKAVPPATDAQIESFLAEQVRDAGYPGAAFAIVRDGRVTHAGGIGRADGTGRVMRADTPFVIGSLSKAITATAVMQLVEHGQIELDAPVTRYVPDFAVADDRAGAITIRHLLHQTSGLSAAAGVAPLSEEVTSLEAQVAALRRTALTSDPGSAFAYSNANYVVLGRVVERVTGTPFGQRVVDAVFRPLRMDHAHVDLAAARADGLTDAHRFWFGIPRGGEPLWRPDLQPAGWLIASAHDLGRFAAANLNGGSLEGERIVSAAGVRTMHLGVAASGTRGAYGMGWVAGRLGSTRIVSHSGSTTDLASAMYLAPDEGAGIVLLLNGQSVLYELLHKPEAISEAAFARMLGEQAGGTLTALYPVFTLAAIAMIVLQLRSLVRIVGRARRNEPTTNLVLRSRRLGIAFAVWGRLVLPAVVLVTTPSSLGAPWEILLQIDLGQVVAAYAGLQLLVGAATIAPWLAQLGRRGRELVSRPSTVQAVG